jgi:hypothetical protein
MHHSAKCTTPPRNITQCHGERAVGRVCRTKVVSVAFQRFEGWTSFPPSRSRAYAVLMCCLCSHSGLNAPFNQEPVGRISRDEAEHHANLHQEPIVGGVPAAARIGNTSPPSRRRGRLRRPSAPECLLSAHQRAPFAVRPSALPGSQDIGTRSQK